jgi:hypothetical protein
MKKVTLTLAISVLVLHLPVIHGNRLRNTRGMIDGGEQEVS